MKQITGVYTAPAQHWVGDGFPVRSMFSYQTHGQQLSPFLLLDYAGPYTFPAGSEKRGVGEHPHRGFETVTIVYAGEVEHRDSTARGGVIGPGDVQWMTAGAGILHEEFHSEAFTRSGGELKMIQLWVNLPAEHKMTQPGYQPITAAQIPVVDLPGGVGSVRVIAGAWGDAQGPARTFSPMRVLDLRLDAGKAVDLPQPAGWTTLVVVASGSASVNGAEPVTGPAVVTLSAAGEGVNVQADRDARLLLLAGEPIDEPVVGYGPFVMNSQQQIVDAINDFNSGRFGQGLN